MASKLWGYFEGECNPYPLAWFRILFYAGIALHFFPALLYWDDNFSPQAYRWDQWNHTLFALLPQLPGWVTGMLAATTVAACTAGLLGIYPRAAALVTGLGCYVFASFNALNVQTLAISSAWAVFFVWAVGGGGDEVLSLRSLLHGPKRAGAKATRSLIVFQLLAGFTFAGIEKISAGWVTRNEMSLLLSSPEGYIVRGWIAGTDFARSPLVGWAFTYLTVLIELTIAFWLAWRRTRLAAIVVYQLFFLGIILMLEVPPLFYFLYAGGMLLAIDDATAQKLMQVIKPPRSR